jgi:pyridinium-3,5-biscarboxylic acid mononucleotide sulfurtransferase
VNDARPAGSSAAAPSAPAAEGHDLAAVKRDALVSLLSDLPGIIVAYSGGVDSAYLAYAATQVLGARALCVTASSPSYPERHRQLAVRIAGEFGLNHEFITTDETSRPEYRANPANRCYFCKHELYTRLTHLAHERGFAHVADGTNADDRGDYRPGRIAAKQFGVRSPLDEAGMTKNQIR